MVYVQQETEGTTLGSGERRTAREKENEGTGDK